MCPTISVPWWPTPTSPSTRARSSPATCGRGGAQRRRLSCTSSSWRAMGRRSRWPASSATTRPGRCAMPKGMFVDTSVCIGCKACQVACKEWNELEGEPEHFAVQPDGLLKAINFTGDSYDNTGHLSSTNWRHVRFIENIPADRSTTAWYMMSDSCKHCQQAGCLEVCPTHALMRTDLDNVIIQQDVCNGCRAFIPACPFGVISYNKKTGRVNKCTL